MKVENIQTANDAQRYLQGVINDFETGSSTKEETMGLLGEYTGHIMGLFWRNALRLIGNGDEVLPHDDEWEQMGDRWKSPKQQYAFDKGYDFARDRLHYYVKEHSEQVENELIVKENDKK